MSEEERQVNDDDQRESDVGFRYYLKHKWNLYVTLFCLFSFLTMGLHLEMSGSTMLALSVQVGTDLSHLSYIVAARSIGFTISIVLFGILFQSITKNHSQLMLAIGYLFPAAATASTPYLKSLWSLCLALLFQGMLQGISDLAVNTLVTTMWLSRSTAPLNSVYLGYAIGALLSILIVRSFRHTDHSIPYGNSTNLLKDRSSIQSDLVGPYLIASLFCLISSVGFGIIAYKEYQKRKKEKVKKVRIYQSVAKEEINLESKSKRLFNKAVFWKTCSPSTCGQGYLAYGFLLISLLLLYNFFFGGIEQGFTKFFVSFVESEQINTNKKDSVYSMIFYWFPMLVGRLLCTFLTASYLSPHVTLFISLILCFLTYIFWLIFLWSIGLTRLSVYLLVTATGFSISSISPTTIGWIKQFLNLSPIELSLILSSNAIGGIVFGLVSGYVFQHYGSKHLFTVLIVAVLSCFILFLLVFVIQRMHSRNNPKSKPNISEEDKALETFLRHDQSLQTNE